MACQCGTGRRGASDSPGWQQQSASTISVGEITTFLHWSELGLAGALLVRAKVKHSKRTPTTVQLFIISNHIINLIARERSDSFVTR